MKVTTDRLLIVNLANTVGCAPMIPEDKEKCQNQSSVKY